MEFIYKLDTRRFESKRERKRYDSLRGNADAYPRTLNEAYKFASDFSIGQHGAYQRREEISNAYVAETVYVTKARVPVKGKGSNMVERGSPTSSAPIQDKRSTSSTVKCYVCGKMGHYARDCEKRQVAGETALVITGTARSHTWKTDDGESDEDEWEIANVPATETCFFSKYDVLLGNEASLNVFRNRDLIRNIRRSTQTITMHGVANGARGVNLELEGEFNEL